MLKHFSCIHTIFSILLILICVGTFSFSLSLSLSVSCFMAPKCKSTLSWNPLHFGASSSNSTPYHVQFHDEKAHIDFSENF